jgi:hypothetical protein
MTIVFQAMVDDRFAGVISQQGVERAIGFQMHSSAREIGNLICSVRQPEVSNDSPVFMC